MQEKRKHPRKKPSESLEILKVYDRDTQAYLGNAVDLSIAGIMLLSQDPIPINRIFQMRMLLPDSVLDENTIEFGAESLWVNPGSDIQQYWSGFQIIDISERNIQVIEALTMTWGA